MMTIGMKMRNMTMTKRSARPKRKTGMLKTFLTVGSLIATLAGTRLLSLQEAGQTETAVPQNDPITTIVLAAPDQTPSLLLPNRGRQIELKQIPQVVQPNIKSVARTKSSK